MIIFPLGEYLKHERKSRKISQGEVSKGLCSVSSLSRIESGKQLPSRKLAEALFSRLGLWLDERLIPMTGIELKCLLDEYEILGNMENLERQQFEFFTALYEFRHNFPLDEVLRKFEKSLEITFQDFDTNLDISERYLSKTEIIIINNIALVFYENGRKEDAITIMKNLFSYYKKKPVEKDEYNKNVPTLLFNLTNWLGLSERFDETLELIQEGIELCLKENLMQYFPKFIFNKGYCLCKMGKMTEGERLLNESLIMLNSIGLHKEVLQVISQIKSIFGFDVWKHIELDN